MTTKLAKIVLSVVAGMLGLVLVMAVLAGAGPAVAMEDGGQDGGGALVAAGVPNAVLVFADPPEILADGDSTSTITGRATSNCIPVPGAFMAFTTSLGTIDQYCYAEAEHPSVIKSSGWSTETWPEASGGKYVRTCGLVHPDASLSWTFTATAISMLYIEGQDGGMADVWVDNGPHVAVDMCAVTTTAAERVITAGLSYGSHIMNVKWGGVSCGTACNIRIDAFRCGTTTNESGEATATLTSTVLSCGSEDATVTALTGDPSIPYMITGTQPFGVVKFAASAPNSVTVTAIPNQIAADRTSTSTLEAVVRDQFGQYVPDCTLVGFVATDEASAALTGEAWVTLPYKLVEGEDPEVIQSGLWSTDTNLLHHGGEVISSTTADDTAVWTFTGTAVSLIYPKLSDAGVATVTVHGGAPITIDMYASPGQYQIEHVIASCLNYGPHVITVTVAGYTVTGGTDKRVYVDAFRSGVSTSGGKAMAVLTSGTKAGVVMVEATAVGRQCCETYSDSVKTDTVPITLTAGNPYTLTITPTDIITTCCFTETLQFTVTDRYSNVVGAVWPTTLTVNFTSTPHARITDTNVLITEGVGSVEIHGWMSGTGTVTGTVSGYPSVFDTVNLTVTASSCQTLTISPDHRPWLYVTDTNTSLLANFPYTTIITADLRDKCNNPMYGTVVTFSTSLGSLSPVTRTTISGVATATLTSGQLSGAPTRTAYITVTGADCPVSDTTSVNFGRHVYTLTVAANPDEVGVGGYTSTLTAVVTNGFGSPVLNGVMVGFTITPTARATVPYEYVEAEGAKVTAPGWLTNTAFGGVTYIATNTVGAQASWNFTGTAVSFIYRQDSSIGEVTVTIDSPPYIRIIDLSGPTAAWVERVITTGLSLDFRTVIVAVKSVAPGEWIRLDAFRSGTTISGGAGKATATATSGIRPGVATIEAAAIGSTITNTAQITITTGNPYTLTITPTDVSIPCCMTRTLQFTVTDQYSNVVGAVWPTTLTVNFTSTPHVVITSTSVLITKGVGSVGIHGWMSGTGTVTGTVSGYPVTGTVNLTVTAGSCQTLTISPGHLPWLYVTDTNTSLLANFPYTTIITAELEDKCNNPIYGTVVTFNTSLGSLSPFTRTTVSGVATATLTSGQLSGAPTRTAYITVTGASCPVSDMTSVNFGRHVYTLTVTADPDQIQAGGNNSTLTAVVTDGFGSPVLNGVMVGFTITPTTRATVPYEYVEAEGAKVTAPGWAQGSAGGVTWIQTSTVGASASWNFTGTAISFIHYRQGAVTVTIDSPPYTKVLDLSGPGTWVETVITTGLNFGSRTVIVTVKDPTTVYLDAFRSGTTTSGGKATATATSGTQPGVATIEAAAIGSTITNTALITITAGEPHTLTLTPTDISITCCITSTLQFTVTDQYDNQVGELSSQPVTVCLDCPGGLVDTWSPTRCVVIMTGTGRVDFHGWKSGTGYILAYYSKNPEVNDTSNLTVSAGSPGGLTVTRAPATILADGETAIITATVEDACGNPVCNRVVTFTTDLGSFEPDPHITHEITKTTICPGGVATATLRSVCVSGKATITVTVDSLTGTTHVDIVGVVGDVQLVANPISIEVGGSTSNLTATVKDGVGTPLEGKVVTFTTSLGTLGSPPPLTKVTAADGVATATLTSQAMAGTAVITATADSKVATATVEFTPLSPATVTLVAYPSSIPISGSTSTLTATVTDQYDNPVRPTVVTFTTSLGSLGSPVPLTKTTTGGVATATLTSETEAGTAFITATADSKSGTTTVIFEPDPPYTLTLEAHPTNLTVGESSTLTATVKDQYDNNVANGTSVHFETSLGNVGSTTIDKPTTDGIAVATLTSPSPGTAAVTATAGAVSDTVDVTFAGGPPYTVTLEANPSSIPISGSTSTLTATVTDQYDNPVRPTVVTFTTSLGSLGSPVPLTKTTTGGVATATLTSETEAGTAFITATADSRSGTATVIFEPDPPYTVTLTAYPTSLSVGGTSSLTATVTDRYSNNVANGTGVTFETSLGSLGSVTVTRSTANGVATATLTSQIPGTATVKATADTVSGTVNVIFQAGLPYTVTLTANPTSILVGGYTSTLTVSATDQLNNNVADGTVVTFATSLGSLGSVTVTKSTVNGVATATLTSGNTAGVAVVTATADSKVAAATVTFRPDVPYTVTLTAYPTSLSVGGTSSLTATVTDRYSNNVANGTVITFETSLGSLGSVTVTRSTANGVATATLTSQIPGTATVKATADSVSGTVNVTFQAGLPYTVTLTANPTSILVGGYTSTLTVSATDQLNNNVADGTVVTFATSLGSLGSVTVTKTTVNGVATATLTSGNIVGVATVTATTGSKVVTTTVTFRPDVPYTITLVAYPMTLAVGDSSSLTATVKDQYNNNVANGTVVTFETSLGSLGSITVTKPTTNGVAVATLTSQLPGIAMITATADSRVATTTVEFRHGLPYTVTLVAYPVSLTVGNSSSLTATVKDQYNNNVADGTIVTFTTNLGDVGSKSVTKVTTSGVATANLTSQVAGTALVTATADLKYATANVTFNPGPPYTMTVMAYPTSIPIGWFTSTITATVKDQYANPVADGTAVTLATDLGSIGSSSVVKLTKNGIATATLTSGLIIGTANVSATSDSVVGQTQVIFTVGAPFTVTAESWPPTIEVGGNRATITATVTDIGGYAAANGTPVVFTTDFGSLGSSTVTRTTVSGVATATLTSGLTPGVAHITATAGSKSGTAIVKIAAGPPSSINVTANPTYIPIGGATSSITATVKDQYGNNVTNGTNVDFTTTLGTLSPSSDATEEGMVGTTLTSGENIGTARVTAISGSASGWVDVVFTIGPPFYVDVVANPTSIGLNGQTSNIQAMVRDAGGNNVADGTKVIFITSLGALGSNTVTKTTTSGVAIAVLTSGTTAGTAVITATADSRYDVTEVVFNPDPPYTVTLTAKPWTIPANGISTSAVRATVTDQYGNLVADGINCYFQTTLGSVWPLSDTTLNGVAETTLTSSEDPGLATVTATCEGRPGTVYVIFYYPLKLYLPVIRKAH